MSLTAWRISIVKGKKKQQTPTPSGSGEASLSLRDGAVWPRRPERQEYMAENTSAHLEWTQSTVRLCLAHTAGEKRHLQVFKEALPRPIQSTEHCLLLSSENKRSKRRFIYGPMGSAPSRIFLQESVRVSPKPSALLTFTWFKNRLERMQLFPSNLSRGAGGGGRMLLEYL